MEVKIKEEILKEFNDLMRSSNDPKRCIIIMLLRRCNFLLNLVDVVLKRTNYNDNNAINNIKEEVDSITLLFMREK